MQISVDFQRLSGPVKPMHGINNAPLLIDEDDHLFPWLKRAGIPYARLHDTGGCYGGGKFVNIHNIFPDADADPTLPSSYDFAFTDWLLTRLKRQGVEPFYRLGASIENSHRIRARYIDPPRDPEKWAQICEGIVRHYNEGWADGYQMGITYWEIWNEPDNEPDPADNPMWKGGMTEYFTLYETVSNHLKRRFPKLKIGGYGSCGFYALLEEGAAVEAAHSSSRTDYFLEFFEAFLSFITSEAHHSPLDFFSWHSYSGIQENIRYARHVRQRLDAYGLVHTESLLNEWNCGIRERGTRLDAARIAAMMCAMQANGVDQLAYYDGQVYTPYGGLFDAMNGTPLPAFEAFEMFDSLYRLGRLAAFDSDPGLYALAAGDGKQGAVLAANPSAQAMRLRCRAGGLPAGTAVHGRLLGTENPLILRRLGEGEFEMELPGPGVLLLQFA